MNRIIGIDSFHEDDNTDTFGPMPESCICWPCCLTPEKAILKEIKFEGEIRMVCPLCGSYY